MSRYDTDYSKMGFSTRAIKIGEGVDPVTKALNTPIYETSTYGYETAEQYDEMLARGAQWEPDIYIYSRTTNPTTNALEKKVMSLEGAEDALICSCGMAAISNALLSNLDVGDHVICSDDTFMCTSSMFADILPAKGIETDRVEILDLNNIEKAIKPNTKVIYLEALSNPQLKLADIPAIADLAHKHGLKFIVDNTFLSPVVMRPLELGADMVVHSGTKYYVGHGDALCGIVAGRKEDIDRVRYYYDNFGSHISPFNAWLALRSVRTMQLRVERQCQNAMTLAKWFEKRPEVESDEHLSQVEYRINVRPSSIKISKNYTGRNWDKEIENRKSSTRCKVEHPFLIVKRQFGYAKVVYRGIAKNFHRFNVLFACANLVMCARAGRMEELCRA